MNDPRAPSPGPAAPDAPRGRLTLLAITALFLLPVLVAVFLNSRWTDWRPDATRNYGTLLEPPVALPDELVMVRREGPTTAPAWTLALAPASCADGCAVLIDELARLDRSLGRDAGDVAIVVLGAPAAPATPGVAFRDRPAGWAPFLASLALPPDAPILIDPLGYVMMAYPPTYDAGRIRKDLARLLRYSRFDRP